MSVNDSWMIYGANGYTGKLIADEAVKRGYRPILAGRNEAVIEKIATDLCLPFRCFALDSAQTCEKQLQDVQVVVNCAGPFMYTAKALRAACLASNSHYIDITGEMDVLESSLALNAQAKERGVAIISGVGFDVVPTDMLAHELKQALPEATHLELAFTGGGVSAGTAKTIVATLADGGKVRENGEIVTVPLAHKAKDIAFADKTRHAMTIPWGDIVTAYYTTGIDNIDIYTATTEKDVRWARRVAPLTKVLKWQALTRALQALLSKVIKGPSQTERDSSQVQLWGKASVANDPKKQCEMTMQTPDGYALTIQNALLFVEQLFADNITAGAHTPAQAISTKLFLEIDGVVLSK